MFNYQGIYDDCSRYIGVYTLIYLSCVSVVSTCILRLAYWLLVISGFFFDFITSGFLV